MMSVAPIPVSWLAALRPGGRLFTVLAGTGLLVTADKTADGGAAGRTEWYRAGFMTARSGPDYPPTLLDQYPQARDGTGEHVTTGKYPVVNIGNAWELYSMLGVTLRGTHGKLPAYGATVTIGPDGTITLKRGRWQATITQTA